MSCLQDRIAAGELALISCMGLRVSRMRHTTEVRMAPHVEDRVDGRVEILRRFKGALN